LLEYRDPNFGSRYSVPKDEMLVVTDFPDASGNAERLCFTNPRELIVAERTSDVRSALGRVERAAAAGHYAVGFVAYDAAPAFDAALRVGGHAATPLLWFGIYDAPHRAPYTRAPAALTDVSWKPHVERAEYENAIADIRRGIGEGSFYQVSHTIRLRANGLDDPRGTYESLHSAQPSSYGMYLDIGRFTILSVSPELFFETSGRGIRTRPMKGTARRGRWSDEDAACAVALAASSKDRAENVMIVDLVRNDLGRIAEVGTVAVPHLFEVERHPTLWQMTSTIIATLRPDAQLTDIFAALFPCGSVVGAPKVAAASWIADHETAPRGVYCGAIGIVRPGGDCVFNVAIRTLVIDGESGTGEYGAGGGITIDSTAVGEYDELLAKAAILGNVPTNFDLLETMRLCNGVYTRLDRHMRRLLSSADYFDFPGIASAVDDALCDCAIRYPEGDHRVRLVVSRDGTARTDATPVAPLDSATRASPRCVIDNAPLSSRDPFRFHKTTRRDVYNERRAAHPAVDEVILVNERGEATECTIGNFVVEIDGERLTPPLTCGLLPGVFREELIELGAVSERVLYPAEVAAATRIWLVNSLREWVELDLTRQ
jgi:para-aminobenzoate synthetase/4-amino-4-deoxychorismate lyase